MSHPPYHLSLQGEGLRVNLDISADIAGRIIHLMMHDPGRTPEQLVQAQKPVLAIGAQSVGQGSEAAREEATRLAKYLRTLPPDLTHPGKIISLALYACGQDSGQRFTRDMIKRLYELAQWQQPGSPSREYRFVVKRGYFKVEGTREYVLTQKALDEAKAHYPNVRLTAWPIPYHFAEVQGELSSEPKENIPEETLALFEYMKTLPAKLNHIGRIVSLAVYASKEEEGYRFTRDTIMHLYRQVKWKKPVSWSQEFRKGIDKGYFRIERSNEESSYALTPKALADLASHSLSLHSHRGRPLKS